MLGVRESEVGVWSGDTEAHEGGAGTYASRSTVFVANALADAVDHLRSKAEKGAARLLACETHEVTFNEEGPAHDTEQLRWKDVAPIDVVGRFEMKEPTYGFGVHLALVSVDVETGDVIPERMAIAYDCGRVLDHSNVVDQIVGAAAMGVGAALHEKFVYDSSGNPVSSNLSDYLIPTGTDLPAMEVFVFETAAAIGNPLGLKGVGEAGIVGVGAAIANAVVDALGPSGDAVVTRLPIDRQAIALHQASGGNPE
jgi:CO/xanthine dehydrogenase Mo-binding subunit